MRCILIAGLGLAISSVCWGQVSPEDQYLEWQDMEPLAPATARPGPPGATTGGLDAPGSVQVNVDGFGMDILGDAANEPSIGVDPSAPNRIVIGWRQFDTIASNFRQAGVGWSNDGGRTWHASTLDRGNFRSDPVLATDSAGRFYYYSLDGSFLCDVFYSDDGGQNWSSPLPGFGGDKNWLIVDNSGSAGDGTLYAFWNSAFGCCGDNWFTRSFDRAGTFDAPVGFASQPIWGTADTLANGDVLVAGRRQSSSSRFIVARSESAKFPGMAPAFTATEPTLDGAIAFRAAPNPGGLAGQVWLAADRSGSVTDGNVYVLASVDPAGDDPLDVMITRSEDGGVTWSDPVRVNDDVGSNWQWFGTMSVAPNGRIDVIWNDTRDTGADNISALYYASSDDGGRTWSPNQQLSDTFDSHLGWPQQNKLGDYYHMVSDRVGAHLAWAATFTGGQDVYYQRIGDYDCNDNGVPDTDDISTGASGDCNANGIPDECEIAAGAVRDDNMNGIPDECEDCYADCDGDGILDLFDFLCFQNAFATANPYADCDGNGVLDIFDFLCFQNEFGAGCP